MANFDPNFSEADERLSELLGSLPRVEAPRNFEFRVRARIAKGRPVVHRSWLPTFGKIAVPAALVLSAGGYIWLNTGAVSIATDTQPRPQAAVPAERDGLRKELAIVPQAEAKSPADPVVASVRPPVPVKPASTLHVSQKASVKPSSNANTGGSIIEAKRTATVIDANTGSAAAVPAPNRVVAISALASFGIHAALSGGSFAVTSVTAGSVSERAGLKAGDVIEAVNGRAVTASTSFANASEIRSLTIKRDGKTLEISLAR